LPALAAEAMPVLDLAPTWTASVLLVTAGEGRRRWWWVAAAALAVALAAWAILRLHHA
jgi:hypothetical protein